MAAMKTAMITLLMLSRVHCDTAVNLTTELAQEETGSEPQYEGTIFTTEKQNSNGSVQTTGNSQLLDDRYTTDVDEVPNNASGGEGFDAGSHDDTTEDGSTSNGIQSDGYQGRGRHNNTGTGGNISAYIAKIGRRYHTDVAKPCNDELTDNISSPQSTCGNLGDPQCCFDRSHSFPDFLNSFNILRSIYNLRTQYKEEERRNSSLDGQSESNDGNTEATQDLNETQQTSTSSHTGSQEYDVTAAATTNLSTFEQTHNILLHNCSNIYDQNCHISLTTANITDISHIPLTEYNDTELQTEIPETRSSNRTRPTAIPVVGIGARR